MEKKTNYNLEESSIPTSFTTCVTETGYQWELVDSAKFYGILFKSLAQFAKNNEVKNGKSCVRINDTQGNLLLAAVVTHSDNETGEGPGNFDFVYTMNEEDLEGCASDKSIQDIGFQQLIIDMAYREEGFTFLSFNYIYSLIIIAVNCIKEWLDNNADEHDKITVSLPGYFDASVQVEDGEKVMAITPAGSNKADIKNDDINQK